MNYDWCMRHHIHFRSEEIIVEKYANIDPVLEHRLRCDPQCTSHPLWLSSTRPQFVRNHLPMERNRAETRMHFTRYCYTSENGSSGGITTTGDWHFNSFWDRQTRKLTNLICSFSLCLSVFFPSVLTIGRWCQYLRWPSETYASVKLFLIT